MVERNYQHNFSRMIAGAMYNRHTRERKAITLLAVLQDFFQKIDTSGLNLLDMGSSTGIIDNFLADHFGHVTGVDIDSEAIEYANKSFQKKNLDFGTGDAMNLAFTDNSFDVVICTQIYEHVPNAQDMIKEIFRVLKPGGICYFAAGNRISLMEPHYRLPLLSILPRPLAHIYMKITGKGSYYHEKHLTLPGLKKLVSAFMVHDYTKKIIDDPILYKAAYMLKPGSLKHKTAQFMVRYAYWFCPTYVWILEKPSN